MMKNNVIRPFMEVYNLETFIYYSRISDGSYEILIMVDCGLFDSFNLGLNSTLELYNSGHVI